MNIQATSKGSDQTAGMRRLICGFAGCTYHIIRNLMSRLLYNIYSSYLSVFIYCMNLHQFLILCSSKAMMFVKLYVRTSDIYLISLVSLDPSGFHLRTKHMPSNEKEPIYDVYCISGRQYQRLLNILSVAQLVASMSGVVLGMSCHGRGFESR